MREFLLRNREHFYFAFVVLFWLWICGVLGACMPTVDEYGVSGLATAPNPQVGAPPGALKQADNCVIRRAGMIEPRPGFTNSTALTTISRIDKIIPYDGDFLSIDTSFSTPKWSNDTSFTASFTKHQARGVETRKNLYLTTSDRLRKATGALMTGTAPRAGLPATVVVIQSDTGTGPVLASQAVAYRALLVRRDVNNVIVRGAPSGRAVYQPSADKTPTVRAYFAVQEDVQAGDALELYRTKNATVVPPPDELFLAATATLTATDISNGYHDFVDTILDANLGVALYTNGTQEGIERANVLPPLGTDLAVYQGSLFSANMRWRHAYDLIWSESSAVATGAATATGIRARTDLSGTYTNGSANIVVADAGGLQVGMIIIPEVIGSWNGAGAITITTIAGTTITASATYTGATGGGKVTTFYDSIAVGTSANGSGVKYYPAYLAALFTQTLAVSNATYRTTASTVVSGLAEGDSSYQISPTGFSTGQAREVLLERFAPSDGAFYLWATHGNEYQPALPLPAASMPTGQTSAQDYFPNGLTWSKQYQPEHFMRKPLWLVGSAKAPIIRVVALTDGLYIFKGRGDGVYRLTGFSELTGWSVNRIDDTTALLHPELLTVMAGSIYAWTQTGMVRFGADGATTLSGPIWDQTQSIERTLDPMSATPGYAYAASSLSDSSAELVFGLPTANTNSLVPAKAYVYNALTNAWTTWFSTGLAPITMAYDPIAKALRAGRNTSTPLIETSASDAVQNADTAIPITINSCNAALLVTIAAASGYTPAVGGLISYDAGGGVTVAALITAVTDTTHFTVSAAVTPGSASGWSSFVSTIELLPKNPGGGGLLKRWIELDTHWDDVYGLYSWAWSVTGPGNGGNTYAPSYTRTWARTHARAETIVQPDRNVATDTQFYFTLTIANAGAQWRIAGFDPTYEPAGSRVAR